MWVCVTPSIILVTKYNYLFKIKHSVLYILKNCFKFSMFSYQVPTNERNL